jgi:hypothetical protein
MLVLQAGVSQIVLAVSYRAEMLEKEMKVEEERVCMSSEAVQRSKVQFDLPNKTREEK